MRSVVGSVLEVVGVGVVVGAAWSADPRLAIALIGLILIGVGYLLSAPRPGRKG